MENALNGNSQEYYDFFDTLNLDGVNFPATIRDIKIFVEQNRHLNISVNILGYFHGNIYTMHLNIGKGEEPINFLALDIFDSKTMQGVTHESCSYEHLLHITNIDLFLRERYPGDSRNYTYWRNWCLKCFSNFSTKELLEEHRSFCLNPKHQREVANNFQLAYSAYF